MRDYPYLAFLQVLAKIGYRLSQNLESFLFIEYI